MIKKNLLLSILSSEIKYKIYFTDVSFDFKIVLFYPLGDMVFQNKKAILYQINTENVPFFSSFLHFLKY